MAFKYEAEGVEEIRWLRDAYGDELILTGDREDSEPYRVLAEFTYYGRPYAVLQSKSLERNEEQDVAIFRLVRTGGTVEVETIEDDEEWEQISEVFDEMWFASFK